jgi:hypothetical protein
MAQSIPFIPGVPARVGNSFVLSLARADEHAHPDSVNRLWNSSSLVNENFNVANTAHKDVVSGIWASDCFDRLSIVGRDRPIVGYRLPIQINIAPTCGQIGPIKKGISYLFYDSGSFSGICHDQRNRSTTFWTKSDGIVTGEDICSFGSDESIGGFLGSIGRCLRRLECPKNQKALTSAGNYQRASENHQQEIKPPARIIWWRRGVASLVLLCSSVYAVRNGLLDLLGGKKIYGWSWLFGTLLCAGWICFAAGAWAVIDRTNLPTVRTKAPVRELRDAILASPNRGSVSCSVL